MCRHNFPNSNHNNTFLRHDKASVKQKGTENRLPRGWRKIFNACKCKSLCRIRANNSGAPPAREARAWAEPHS